MSNEIVRAEQLSTIDLANAMQAATLLPAAYRKQPANLLFAFEYADSIGIPRVSALSSIHVIDGKPTASADLIAALVRRAGHKLRITVSTDTEAVVEIVRADDPGVTLAPIRWDAEKARKAGKWGSKGPWSDYPSAMLRARAITEAARAHASDALYGIVYTPEELGADVDADGEPVSTPVMVTKPQPAPSLTERLTAKATGRTTAEAKQELVAACGGDTTHAAEIWAQHQPNSGASGVTDTEMATLLEAARIVDAEIVPEHDVDPSGHEPELEPFPEWDQEPPEGIDFAEVGTPLLTDKQLRMISALLNERRIEGDDRHEIISSLIGREITSTKDVTKVEASKLIDDLKNVPVAGAMIP